ncbi:hypothetical protein, partial [Escherichia coli]
MCIRDRAWGEQITGVPRQYIESIAREFADTAHKTHGRSMIILGAGVNHWYHMDMNYRGMINMPVSYTHLRAHETLVS